MKPDPSKLSIIIAAYNEEGTITHAVKEVMRLLPGAEIIIVNDGSHDNTLAMARSVASDLVKVVDYGANRGKGHAIRAGIGAATRSIMVQLDADLQFPPEGLPVLIGPIFSNTADIVFGSRYLAVSKIDEGSVSLIKRWASYVMAFFVSGFTSQRYTDVFAGFKAWKSEVIRHIDLKEDGFTYEAEIAIKAKRLGYRVMEVPTGYVKRSSGQSKIRLFYHVLTVGWGVVKLGFGWDRK